MSTEYSVEEVAPARGELDVIRQAIEERDAAMQACDDLAQRMVYKGNSVGWWHSKATTYRAALDECWKALGELGIRADGKTHVADVIRTLTAPTHPPAQAAQVDDKVVVIRDGKSTTQGLVLAAAIYMGAVKDVFALRSDGPPYNERKVTKDAAALRAFDHLDAATKALRSAISHYTPTAEPVAHGEAGNFSDAEIQLAIDYSRNYATARPDTPAIVKEHILGLCERLQSLLADRQTAQPRAVPDGAWPKMELWFFRDLTSAQRLALFALHSLPVDEIGESHVNQKRMLRHLLTATPLPAAQPRAVPKLDAEDWAVLQRLRNALPDVGLNGWHRGVTVLSKLLAAAPSPGESA